MRGAKRAIETIERWEGIASDFAHHVRLQGQSPLRNDELKRGSVVIVSCSGDIAGRIICFVRIVDLRKGS
ncbi:MAG: hypothetical protein QOJ64_4388 [Acidobacteriota bacterium]|jgi:hypothetical protein|nr:hypothetical protein [Acidobacteriota bacterium]